MKIGFINVGAPAGGMNAAVRAAVAYCLSRGHEPLAIHNGFAGFARHHCDKPVGSVRPFNWLEVDGWASSTSLMLYSSLAVLRLSTQSLSCV